MKRAGIFALIFLAAAGTAAATAGQRHSARPSAVRCGGTLWRLKTFSDPQRRKVDLAPQQTTTAAIRERKGPGQPPTRRTTPFQLHTWEVPAQITSYKLEATGAIRLVLFDNGSYMNAVIPAPSCLSARTRERAEMIATWQAFVARCGKGTSTWQSLGAVFFVRGVGFWSQKRQLRGAAPNGAELHPVTGLRVVVSC
jgi:hypothetical protein